MYSNSNNNIIIITVIYKLKVTSNISNIILKKIKFVNQGTEVLDIS
jgi:hypothetical protein